MITKYEYELLKKDRADDVLTCVMWEDEKPTKIDDLIRDYESHKEITGGNNMNKAELIKEIEGILDDIAVSDYQLGECDEDTIWTISSIAIREILSAIEKHIPVSVGDKLDEPEVLSQEWIDDNKEMYLINDTSENAVPDYKLQNLLAPKQELPVIPKYVADWIEEVKGLKRNFKLEYLFDTSEMPDDVYDWLDERYGDTDILAKAWMDGFVVEKEKLYTVRLKNGYHLCKYAGTGVRWLNMKEFNTSDCYKLTQSEIESVDPVLMQIAKEVTP